MGLVRIARYMSINQRAPHYLSNAVDERVLDTAVRNVNNPVGAELKQPELGGVEPSTNGQPRTQPESGC